MTMMFQMTIGIGNVVTPGWCKARRTVETAKPLNAIGAPKTNSQSLTPGGFGQLGRQCVAEERLGEEFTEQRPEFHQVGADE
ncbi:MAG: hypothetical protein PHQ28_01780, partial [Mycobacterium sp.]|nr:hypothetical protein [Mycobacterium sp.]